MRWVHLQPVFCEFGLRLLAVGDLRHLAPRPLGEEGCGRGQAVLLLHVNPLRPGPNLLQATKQFSQGSLQQMNK